MTKKNNAMVVEYNRMTAEYLYQIYTTCSAAKMQAYEQCKALQKEMGGYAARVRKCGSSFFTYAFKYMENGKEHLCYMTGRNIYKFALE
jgi:hypothetical protein